MTRQASPLARRLVRWRAEVETRRAALRRTAWERRDSLASLALIVLGLGGALAGGALIGEWCLGVVMMAESACLVWLGLARDDGAGLPRRGERSVAEVLEEERRWP